MDARHSPQRILSIHPADQSAQFDFDPWPPPLFRDFQRHNARKPARCQRTTVSGLTIVIASRIEGNKR